MSDLFRQIVNEMIDDKVDETSQAAQMAKAQGLEYMGFGRHGKNGKMTHRSQNGKLIKVNVKSVTPQDKFNAAADKSDAEDKAWAKEKGSKEVKRIKQLYGEPKPEQPTKQISRKTAQRNMSRAGNYDNPNSPDYLGYDEPEQEPKKPAVAKKNLLSSHEQRYYRNRGIQVLPVKNSKSDMFAVARNGKVIGHIWDDNGDINAAAKNGASWDGYKNWMDAIDHLRDEA